MERKKKLAQSISVNWSRINSRSIANDQTSILYKRDPITNWYIYILNKLWKIGVYKALFGEHPISTDCTGILTFFFALCGFPDAFRMPVSSDANRIFFFYWHWDASNVKTSYNVWIMQKKGWRSKLYEKLKGRSEQGVQVHNHTRQTDRQTEKRIVL